MLSVEGFLAGTVELRQLARLRDRFSLRVEHARVGEDLVGDEGGGIDRPNTVDLCESKEDVALWCAVLPDEEAARRQQPIGVNGAVQSYVLTQVVDVARLRELGDRDEGLARRSKVS